MPCAPAREGQAIRAILIAPLAPTRRAAALDHLCRPKACRPATTAAFALSTAATAALMLAGDDVPIPDQSERWTTLAGPGPVSAGQFSDVIFRRVTRAGATNASTVACGKLVSALLHGHSP